MMTQKLFTPLHFKRSSALRGGKCYRIRAAIRPVLDEFERRILLAYLEMLAPSGFGAEVSYNGATAQNSIQLSESTLATNPNGLYTLEALSSGQNYIFLDSLLFTPAGASIQDGALAFTGAYFQYAFGANNINGSDGTAIADETGTVNDGSDPSAPPQFGPLLFEIAAGPGEQNGQPVSVEISAMEATPSYDTSTTFSYFVGYNLGGNLTPVLSGNEQNAASSPTDNTVYIDAKIGDTFGIDALNQDSSTIQEFYQTITGFNVSLVPNVKIDDVAVDGAGPSINYDYQTTDDPVPFLVGLYFSPTQTYDPATAVPVLDPATGQPAVQTVTPTEPDEPPTEGTFDFSQPPADPAQLPYLFAVADPQDTVSPANADKAASLTLPDISVTSLDWHPDNAATWSTDPQNAGGVDFDYTINNSDLAQSVRTASPKPFCG
jgi:hypothetical protein